VQRQIYNILELSPQELEDNVRIWKEETNQTGEVKDLILPWMDNVLSLAIYENDFKPISFEHSTLTKVGIGAGVVAGGFTAYKLLNKSANALLAEGLKKLLKVTEGSKGFIQTTSIGRSFFAGLFIESSIMFSLDLYQYFANSKGDAEPSIDCVFDKHTIKAIYKRPQEGYGIGSSVYEVWKEIHINGNSSAAYLNIISLPVMMSSMYVDFMLNILSLYHDTDLFNQHIKLWADTAAELLGMSPNKIGGKFADIISNEKTTTGVYSHINGNRVITLLSTSRNNQFDDAKVLFPDVEEEINKLRQTLYDRFSNVNIGSYNLEQIIDIIYSGIGINAQKSINSFTDTPIANFLQYLNDMRFYSPEYYRAACSSLVEMSGFGMISVFLNDAEIIFSNIISSIERPSIDSLSAEFNKYLEIYKKYTASVTITSEEYDHIIKRARTLIAYGGRYQKNITSEVEINKAIFEILRITSYALLKSKHIYEMRLYTKMAFEGGDSSDTRYYKTFILPYVRPGFTEFMLLSVRKNIIVPGGDLILVATAFAIIGKVLEIALAATFGIKASLAAIIASAVIGIAFGGYYLFNLVMDDVNEKNIEKSFGFKTDIESPIESVRQFIENAPMVYTAFALMKQLADAITRNAFVYNTTTLYPPEVGTDIAPVHLEDPEVWMASPCRYYPNNSKKGLSVLHPAFWIWQDSGDLERIRQEAEITSALAAANLISPASEEEIEAAYQASRDSLINKAIDNNLILNEIFITIIRPLIIKIHHKNLNLFKLAKAILNEKKRDIKVKLVSEYATELVNEVQRIMWYTIVHTIMADGNSNSSDSLRSGVVIEIIGKLHQNLIDEYLRPVKDERWKGKTNQEYIYSNQADYTGSYSAEYGNYRLKMSVIIKISEDEFIKPIITSIEKINNNKPLSYEQMLNDALYSFDGTSLGTVIDDSLIGPKTTMEKVSAQATPSMEVYLNALNKYVNLGNRRSKFSLYTYLKKSYAGSDDGIPLISAESNSNMPSSKIYTAFDGNEATMVEGSLFRYVRSRKDLSRSISALADIDIKSKTIAALMERESLLGSTIGAYGQAGVQMYQDRINEIIYKEVHRQYSNQIAKMNPVYKVYFLQENNSEWLLFDDYYAHSGIEEIHIYSDVDSPVTTAKITINNFKGTLNNVMADRIYRENPFFYNPSIVSEVNSAFIKPGCRVKIYEGTGTYLTEDDVVFCGEITNLRGSTGVKMQITCVSDGSLLMETIGATTPEVIEVSAFDAMKVSPTTSVQEMAIRQTLINSFVNNVPRSAGRLSEQSIIGGTTSFESNTISLESQSYLDKTVHFQLSILIMALSKVAGWAGIFPAKLQNYGNVSKLIENMYYRGMMSHHGIVENIRITQSPVNFTYYKLMQQNNNNDNENIKKARELIDKHRQVIRNRNSGKNNSWVDEWINTWHNSRASLRLGLFKIKFWFINFLDSLKQIFIGGGYITDTFIAHNETYYDFIKELLLQLPNHVITSRPFNERNTVVIGDQLNGYYRTTSAVRSNEILTNNIIKTLETYRNPTDAVDILLNIAFDKTEESMALFAIWYIYAAKAARILGNASNPLAFVTLPDDSQIQSIVQTINDMVEYGINLEEGADYGKIYEGLTNDQARMLPEDKFYKPEDSVEARWYLILALYTEDPVALLKRIRTPIENNTKITIKELFASNHSRYMDYIRSSQVINEIEIEQPLDVYSSYAAALAIEHASMKVLTWAVNYAVSRSSSHRRISETFYKSNGDIISNNITLQKGFNVAEIKFLSDLTEYDELEDIEETHVQTRTFYIDSRLKRLNKYVTFIKNTPPESSLYPERALAAMGVSVLANLVRDYYTGTIVFRGDSRIHPYDTIVIHDDNNDMYGTIQVKSVVKSITRYGGSITTVTPMLPAYNDFSGSPGSEETGWGVVRDILSLLGIGVTMYALFRGGRAAYRSLYLANKTANITGKLSLFMSKKFKGNMDFIRRVTSGIGRVMKPIHKKLIGEEYIASLQKEYSNSLMKSLSGWNKILKNKISNNKNVPGAPEELLNSFSDEVMKHYNKQLVREMDELLTQNRDWNPEEIGQLINNARLNAINATKAKYEKIDNIIESIEDNIKSIEKQLKDQKAPEDKIKLIKELSNDIDRKRKIAEDLASSIKNMDSKIRNIKLPKITEFIKNANDEKDKMAIARGVLQEIKNAASTRPFLNAFADVIGIERGASGFINPIATLFSNRGMLGAWGAYQFYSIIGYMLNPVEDWFTAILSEYYGNNAVTISGLFSKGEPFIANLDGMKKGSIISTVSPYRLLMGRFTQNFDYLKKSIYETATSPLIEAETEFTRIELQHNLDNITRKLKQRSEIGNSDEQ
jgi:hypothetical protein